MGRSRHRYQDGRSRVADTFARLPDEVLRSAAYVALPDFAARVLVAVAAKYRGSNNGDLSLTANEARALGVHPEWKLRAGLWTLEAVGLVVSTRRGMISMGRGVCSLYALGWVQIEASEKYDMPTKVAKPPLNHWAKWHPPADWKRQVDAQRRRAQGKASRRKDTLGTSREWQLPTQPELGASPHPGDPMEHLTV